MKTGNKNILVSLIAYRERYLAETIKSCLENAKNPENIYFSVVSEQLKPELHANLSFVDESKIVYKKYDLSEYRGILWSRGKTTEVDFDYDYILFTCGHNLFGHHWDTESLSDLDKAKKLAKKPILTCTGPEFEHNKLDGAVNFDVPSKRIKPTYRPKIADTYVPGYGFPNEFLSAVPETDEVLPDTYLQFSWVFAEKSFIDEIPLDPDMGCHGEEISITVRAWAKGWRIFSSQKNLYYHDTHRDYPGEPMSRTISHRPWTDINKEQYWKQADETLVRLNKLLSGTLPGKYGEVSRDDCLAFCEATGMSSNWCNLIENYDKLNLPTRHAIECRYDSPVVSDE